MIGPPGSRPAQNPHPCLPSPLLLYLPPPQEAGTETALTHRTLYEQPEDLPPGSGMRTISLPLRFKDLLLLLPPLQYKGRWNLLGTEGLMRSRGGSLCRFRCEVGRNKEEGRRCTGALGNRSRMARRQEERHLSEEGCPGALPVGPVRAQLECTMKKRLCFYCAFCLLADGGCCPAFQHLCLTTCELTQLTKPLMGTPCFKIVGGVVPVPLRRTLK